MTKTKEALEALDRLYLALPVGDRQTYETIRACLSADVEGLMEAVELMLEAIENNGIESYDIGTEYGVHQFHDEWAHHAKKALAKFKEGR